MYFLEHLHKVALGGISQILRNLYRGFLRDRQQPLLQLQGVVQEMLRRGHIRGIKGREFRRVLLVQQEAGHAYLLPINEILDGA